MQAKARNSGLFLCPAVERFKAAAQRPDDPPRRVAEAGGERNHRPLDLAPLDWVRRKPGWRACRLPQASLRRNFSGLRFPRLAEGPPAMEAVGPMGRLEFTWEHFE